MTTPDDDEVVDGDYVSLTLPFGWCGIDSGVVVSLSEANT